MFKQFASRLQLALPPEPSLDNIEDSLVTDSRLIRQWFSETLLLWSRWGVVGVLLALAVLFPRHSQWLILFTAIVVAGGNIVAASLLRQGLDSRSLRFAALLATVLEWGTAAGVSVTFRRELEAVSPYVLLLFLLPVSYRYGLRGLLAALASVGVAVTIWLGLHITVFNMLAADSMRLLLIEWIVFLIIAALLTGALIQADLKRSEWERNRLAMFRRERAGLSRREWDVLLLVARSDMTYDDIGYVLNISPETVKTHVHRIGDKLEARGRLAVVQRAREQALIPDDGTTRLRVDTD